MRRFHGASLPHAFALALALTSVLALADCGGKVVCEGGSCGETGTGGSSNGGGPSGGPSATTAAGDPATCSFPIDPPGAPFTFHVHNGGAVAYRLTFGCGKARPIDLVTADGLRSIGSDIAMGCMDSCDTVVPGDFFPACEDCFPEVSKPLLPGATIDISWDHRVYSRYSLGPHCMDCALAKILAPSPSQEGVLTACASADDADYCSQGEQTPVKFTVNTSGSEATIEIK